MNLKKTCMEARIEQLTEENMKLKDKVEGLQDRIDKAIEYIESYLPNYDFDKTNLGELLNILKGDNK